MKTTKPKPDLAFLDKVHEWTFLKQDIHGHSLSREVQAVQARLRGKLRNAQRFIVDDAAIELTAGLSREFDRLETWSFLARLPYDTMWLQFNLHHKIESLRKLDDRMIPVDPDIVSPVVGYLLFRDSDGPSPVWIAHEFYQSPSIDKPYVGMLAYVFDPEGDTMWPVRGSKYWRSPTLSLRKGFPRMPVEITGPRGHDDPITIKADAAPEIALCGIFQPGAMREHTYDEDLNIEAPYPISSPSVEIRVGRDEAGNLHTIEDAVTAPPWFVNRGAVIVDPWWDHYFADRWKTDADRINNLLMHEINECRGVMKFIIALLAAINGLPRDVRPIVTRAGKRAVGMNMLPYLGHSHLKIELPRDNRVVWARQTMDHTAHARGRREHYVLGHWRVVERGRRVKFICRHMPTMVEHGLGMCENCEMLIRWIKVHKRGDPELGMVEHTEYEVTA